MKFPHLPLVALALACAVPAQDSVLRFVPKDSMLVAQMDAPARWPDVFAETRLGEFLAGPIVQDAIAPLREQFEITLEELRDAGQAEHLDLLDALLAFRGRITIALDVDFLFEDPDATPSFSALIALSDGVDGELDELAELVERSAEVSVIDEGLVAVDQVFGDATLRILNSEDDFWVSMPQKIGDDLTMLIWSGEPDQIEAWAQLEESARYDPSRLPAGPLSMHMAFEQVMAAILEMAGSDNPDFEHLMAPLGLTHLRSISMSVATADEFVSIDSSLTWSGDGGLLGMLVPESQGRPRLLDLAPTSAPSWGVSVVRLGVLYDVVATIWDNLADMAPMTREDGEAAFEETFRIRLREDLFDHLGEELLTVADTSSVVDQDVDDPLFALAGQAFALELRDAAAFAESFETMLRARGMHAARKTTDYRGFDVHRLNLAGLLALDYTITDRVFAVSVNSKDSGPLRAILDEEAARRAGEPPASLSDDAMKRLEQMPGGWCGVSVSNADLFFEAFRSGMEAALAEESWGEEPEMPEEIASLLDTMGRLQAAMRDEGLSTMVSATWAQPGEIRARLMW